MLFIALLAASAFQPPPPDEIRVDEKCRILSKDRPNPSGKFNKPEYRSDPAICALKDEHNTEHWEQSVYDGVVNRTKVHIREHSYILHNPTNQTIAFVLDLSLPDGWVIDSTPQPTSVADHMATFRVYARPFETINLHIGARH
jgi:hypothetical protein